MTKGRLDKKQRLAEQRRKRAQAATGLAHGAKTHAGCPGAVGRESAVCGPRNRDV